jgi:nucleoside-diphosphate kinase
MKDLRNEKTFIAIKSESIQRNLIGEFISRFERRGLKLVACKMIVPTRKIVGQHYIDSEEWYASVGDKKIRSMIEKGQAVTETPREIGVRVREALIEQFEGRPLVAMVWEGAHAVELGRKTVGGTNCLTADVGSIRGDYSVDSFYLSDALDLPVRTLVHASSEPAEADREIKIWFKPEEIIDYPMVLDEVLYGKNWGKCVALKEKV